MRIRPTIAAVALALAMAQAGTAGASPAQSGAGSSDARPAADDAILLDQIVIQGSLPAKVVQDLVPAHSIQAVIVVLERNGFKYERKDRIIPTSQIPPAMLAKILKLPPGEPFVLPVKDVTTINALKAGKPPE